MKIKVACSSTLYPFKVAVFLWSPQQKTLEAITVDRYSPSSPEMAVRAP